MTRYSGLYEPVDDVYQNIAHTAALIFDVPIVTVAIAQDARVWFPATAGPQDGGLLPAGPSPSGLLDLSAGPLAVPDISSDSRTSGHAWAQGRDGIRYFAVAPIVIGKSSVVGTLEIMDRKRRRHTSAAQLTILTGLAATIAQLLNLRVGSLATLRTQSEVHAAEIDRRDRAEQVAAQRSQAATQAHDRERPQWCQLGGTQACDRPAELKVADSWGDSAWGCWQHTEDALIQVPSVFLATDSPDSLAAYRRRTSRTPSPELPGPDA